MLQLQQSFVIAQKCEGMFYMPILKLGRWFGIANPQKERRVMKVRIR